MCLTAATFSLKLRGRGGRALDCNQTCVGFGQSSTEGVQHSELFPRDVFKSSDGQDLGDVEVEGLKQI